MHFFPLYWSPAASARIDRQTSQRFHQRRLSLCRRALTLESFFWKVYKIFGRWIWTGCLGAEHTRQPHLDIARIDIFEHLRSTMSCRASLFQNFQKRTKRCILNAGFDTVGYNKKKVNKRVMTKCATYFPGCKLTVYFLNASIRLISVFQFL